jgi:DNA-directed RNA polymerase specialized sigma24 family protein
MNDGELLRQYSETGHEGAFQDLVGRHVDLVYSTALRRMGESHAAEDVTQAVFLPAAP